MHLRKNLLYAFSSNYFKIGVQFIASLFIARLLTPEEFGVFSIAMILVFIADTLRNFGISNYLVQERELTQEKINASATVNILLSWSIAATIALAAPAAATFFSTPGVREVMFVLAINFLLLPFGVLIRAQLQRKLAFRQISIIQASHAFVSASSSVLLAYAGFGYMSLAWASVLSTLTMLLQTWRFRPKDFRARPGLRGITGVVRFGGLSTLTSLTNETGKRMPELIVGRVIGMEATAFYSRANSLIELFRRLILNTISSVAMPYFAARSREGGDLLSDYLKSTAYLTVVGWSFFAFSAIAAPLLIPVLYGDQWNDSILLMQILCLGELFLVPFYLQGQLFIATGRIGLLTKITLATSLARIPAILLLAPAGLTMAIAGYAVSGVAVGLVFLIVLLRATRCPLARFRRAVTPSAFATIVAAAPTLGLAWLVDMSGLPGILQLVLLALVFFLAWIVGIHVARHPIRDELGRLIEKLRRR